MAGEDRKYLAWVARQPCALYGRDCHGDVVAHHRTGGGTGARAHDHDTIPLCFAHHQQFHDLNGFFKGWTKEIIREWQDLEVRIQQARFRLARTFPKPARGAA